ncbi:MAG: hypothetical protein HY586_00645, partial [Candidatus Omnitrophica bacterium]|nr:hypothetical protein [Candidatus Omnitrophota bacterium]
MGPSDTFDSRRVKKVYFKSLVYLLTFIFLTSGISWSYPVAVTPARPLISAPSFVIDIPESLGRVSGAFQPAAATTAQSPDVILIQDMHASSQAQHQIRAILEYLSKNYGYESLFLEGGSGPVDSVYLRFFQNEALNRKMSRRLLDEGTVSGAELFLLESGKRVHAWGLEDALLYRENLAAYRKAAAERKRIGQALSMFLPRLQTSGSHII